jgi:hypothetical protein
VWGSNVWRERCTREVREVYTRGERGVQEERERDEREGREREASSVLERQRHIKMSMCDIKKRCAGGRAAYRNI